MNFRFVTLAAAVSLAAFAGTASATVSQIGDADGFGIGATNGTSFNWAAVGAGDGNGTDAWQFGTQSYTHNYAMPVGATFASLEVFTGGQGLNGLTSVFLNDTLIGTLTDGDNAGPGYNYAWKDTFNLTPYLGLLTGHDTVKFQTVEGGDGWVLDYSKLTVSAVPEPSSYAMLALGLGGLAAVARRRKQR